MSPFQFIHDALAGFRRRRLASRLLRIANRLYQKADFAEAAVAYQQAVDVEPDRAVLRYNLGLALYKGGKKREGRAEWERARELAQGKNVYLVEQVEILLRQFG